AQLLCQLAGGQTFWARLHQQTKNIQPRLLRECGQGSYGTLLIHIFIIMEYSIDVKPPRPSG
ncbi:MAG: hypothetical protein KGH70_04820, partial [Rhodospirillales bacterium]|nr:hypothetical protein [Rhodospirillales bacterium]